MKILVLDNYDSFTYNLVHIVEDILGVSPDVYRNDEIQLLTVTNYDALILSPGPGIPDDAGILKDVIRTYAGKIPIFAVCLGLQAVVEIFGGRLENLQRVYHGVSTTINVIKPESLIFQSLPTTLKVGRYHSWIASKEGFPKSELEITALDTDGNIMAIEHKTKPVYAVQFHPESILTPDGKVLLRNFIYSVK